MHPILAAKGRLTLYLLAWIPGGLIVAAPVAVMGQVPWPEALALSLPLAQIYAFICLSAWYPSQAVPARSSQLWRLVMTHSLGALFSSSAWQLTGAGWALLLDRLPPFVGAYSRFTVQIPLLFGFGLLFYLLAAAASYLYIAFEASRQAEQEALEARKEQALAEQELQLARSLQRRLLPPAEAEGDGYRLAARNLPAQWVAGDFYDYFETSDGRLCLAVADVSGKGMGASLVMASVKGVLPLLAAGNSPQRTLGELNHKLQGELDKREFVALALARYDPASGLLELANAGLPDPYLLRAGEAPRTLEAEPPRLPLGLRRGLEYRGLEIQLRPEDRLLLLSDGLPEASTEPGEPLGYEQLPTFFTTPARRFNAPSSTATGPENLPPSPGNQEPGPWLDAMLERLRQATIAEQEDDWTALLLERVTPNGRA